MIPRWQLLSHDEAHGPLRSVEIDGLRLSYDHTDAYDAHLMRLIREVIREELTFQKGDMLIRVPENDRWRCPSDTHWSAPDWKVGCTYFGKVPLASVIP